MSNFKSKKNLFVLATGIVVFAILVGWPVVFFGLSLLGFYEIGLGQLVFFGITEFVLIILLILLWEIYKKR